MNDTSPYYWDHQMRAYESDMKAYSPLGLHEECGGTEVKPIVLGTKMQEYRAKKAQEFTDFLNNVTRDTP